MPSLVGIEAPVLLAQHERLFHRDDRYPHTRRLSPAPSEESRIYMTDLANPQNPLGQVQGYEQARRRLCHAACTALGRYNHVCNDVAFLLTGPKGDHKAVIARRFAELLRLPFIEMSAPTVKTAHDLFIGISTGLQRAKLPLVDCNGAAGYVLPPCVIFLDCDGLNSIVTAAVLQAVSEALSLDGSKASVIPPTLRTEQGVQVHTIQATWLLATTGRADLMDGLPDRFTELAFTPAGTQAEQTPRAASSASTPNNTPPENLKRWKDSALPRAWVEAHKGEWNDADWLSFLEELQKSEYWPLDPDSVGQVLEELKQAYHQQRRPPTPAPQERSSVSHPAAPQSPVAPLEPSSMSRTAAGTARGSPMATQQPTIYAGTVAANVYDRAFAYFDQEDYDHAILEFSELIRLLPTHARTYFNRASCYYRKSDYVLAIANYKEAIRLDPSDADFNTALAQTEAAARTAGLDPSSAHFHKALADAQSAARFPALALAQACRAAEARQAAGGTPPASQPAPSTPQKPIPVPRSAAPQASAPPSPAIAPEPAEWYCFSGGQQYGPVTWTQLRQWAIAGNIGPTDQVCKAGSATWVLASAVDGLVFSTAALQQQIVQYARAREFDKALILANDLSQRLPACASAYYIRGMLHSLKQLHSLAIADFEEAVRLDPSNVEYHNALSEAEAERNQTGKAKGGFWKGMANAFLGVCDVAQAHATGTVTCPHCMRSIDLFASVCPYCIKEVFRPRF
jgi:tetratricopeptide (TPR) repeat protein